MKARSICILSTFGLLGLVLVAHTSHAQGMAPGAEAESPDGDGRRSLTPYFGYRAGLGIIVQGGGDASHRLDPRGCHGRLSRRPASLGPEPSLGPEHRELWPAPGRHAASRPVQ